MKRTHKGFTLVELLIVVAVIGVLATMMTMSSSDAVDAAGANTILSNLNSMKTAVYQMYMDKPAIATLTNDKVNLNNGDVKAALQGYLGKLAASDMIGIDITQEDTENEIEREIVGGKYDLVGKGKSWYVVYRMDETDSGGVRKKLGEKAADVELYGASEINNSTNNHCGFSGTYSYASGQAAEYYVGLVVFTEE